MTVFEIVAEVAERLEAIGIPYVVGGSLASSAWGQMRQTNDADLAIRVSPDQVGALLAAFPDPYVISPNELQEALASEAPFRCVQLLHMDEAFKLDLFLLGDDAYATSELERARLVEVRSDRHVRFAAPENILIAKLRWFRAGNEVSDRQWNDILQVLDVQARALDMGYLREWSKSFQVEDLLGRALANQ